MINFTRLPGHDINGNPRYVCHYSNLLTEQEKQSDLSLWATSALTHKGGSMPVSKSILIRDLALAKRNAELRFLRRLVGQLRRRISELESTADLADTCPICGRPDAEHDLQCPSEFVPKSTKK